MNNGLMELALALGLDPEDLENMVEEDELDECDGDCEHCHGHHAELSEEELRADWNNSRPDWIDDKMWLTYDEKLVLDALMDERMPDVDDMIRTVVLDVASMFFVNAVTIGQELLELTEEQATVVAKLLYNQLAHRICNNQDDAVELQRLAISHM